MIYQLKEAPQGLVERRGGPRRAGADDEQQEEHEAVPGGVGPAAHADVQVAAVVVEALAIMIFLLYFLLLLLLSLEQRLGGCLESSCCGSPLPKTIFVGEPTPLVWFTRAPFWTRLRHLRVCRSLSSSPFEE